MKHIFTFGVKQLGWAILLLLTCWVVNAWAADGFEFTRQTYDVIMRWVNFIILAVLIIKYARRPIANFLKEKGDEVAIAIEHLESQKQTARNQLVAYQKQLADNEQRMADIKKKIITEGETCKARIIADAQNDSRIMIETAQLRIAHQIRETHARIKSEMIDAAADIAMNRLPDLLTADDEDRLIRKWMEAIQT